MDRDRTIGGIVGLCVGDALGLPVEYRSRSYLRGDPVPGMIGYGTHNQPPGTWSSNISLALCTAEGLARGFSLPDIAARYVMFVRRGHWTPAGEAIDLAPEVQERIEQLARQKSERSLSAGGDNHAFSLLTRTLPLAGTLTGLAHEERFKRVAQVASLIDGGMLNVLGSFILVELALELGSGRAPAEAYSRVRKRVTSMHGKERELAAYDRLLEGNLSDLSEDEILTEGEVVHAVEAAVWCVLTQTDFRSAALLAANLGGASHTTAALVGGLFGYHGGLGVIPAEWIEQLVRGDEIMLVAEQLFKQTAAHR